MATTFDILGIDFTAAGNQVPTTPQGWNTLINFDKGGPSGFSYSGYDQSLILSALKKSMNRGFSLEAVKWGLEQFYTNKFVRQWSWNVLLEYSLESIGPADPYAFLRVKYLKDNFHESPDAYITAVLILTQSVKSNVILFANLLYPELKSVGMPEKLFGGQGTPEKFQQELNQALQNKDLSSIIYIIHALFYIRTQTSAQHYGSNSPITLIVESLANIPAIANSSYMRLMLDAAFQEKWKWEERSIKIFLLIVHLYCSNSIPNITTVQQFPADNVSFLNTYFLSQNAEQRMKIMNFKVGEFPFGLADYHIDLSTGMGRQNKATKDQWIRNVSIIVPESETWKPLSDFYRSYVQQKKSKKL